MTINICIYLDMNINEEPFFFDLLPKYFLNWVMDRYHFLFVSTQLYSEIGLLSFQVLHLLTTVRIGAIQCFLELQSLSK